MHRTTGRFWARFARLPDTVQKVARQNFELLKQNPAHPALHFNHRALGVEDDADVIWVWIGPHDVYKRKIKQQAG